MFGKFGAGFGIVFEGTEDSAGDHAGVGFFDPTHHHAHMDAFDHHGDAMGLENFITRVVDAWKYAMISAKLTSLRVFVRQFAGGEADRPSTQ